MKIAAIFIGMASFCIVICITPLFIKQRDQFIEEIHLSHRYKDSIELYRSLYQRCNGTISRANMDSSNYIK